MTLKDSVSGWRVAGDTFTENPTFAPPGEWQKAPGLMAYLVPRFFVCDAEPFDAFSLWEGNSLYRIELRGGIVRDKSHQYGDHSVYHGRQQRVLFRVEMGGVMFQYARFCALEVADNWNCPSVVRDWLITGNRELAKQAIKLAKRWMRPFSFSPPCPSHSSQAAEHAAAQTMLISTGWFVAREVERAATLSARLAALEMAARNNSYQVDEGKIADLSYETLRSTRRVKFNALIREAMIQQGVEYKF